ncbi:MAG: glycoside hydrolase family 18 protein [bacterium]|nr:glycoside hydrolase family 18 protein [bacterium]
MQKLITFILIFSCSFLCFAGGNSATPKCKVYQSTFVGDSNWQNMWNTIQKGKKPFKYIDRLEIAFARINTDDPDNAFLYYPDTVLDKVTKTITEAKNENKNIEIIAQMDWASKLAPLVEDKTKAKNRLDTFAKSIPAFLNKHKLTGVDFDWESVPGKMTTDLATYLFIQTNTYFNNKYIMSVTPDGSTPTGQSLNINVVNKLFDAVIVQSYNRVYYIDNYIKAGIKPSILFCGICSENDGGFYPPKSDISPYIKKVEEYKLAGLYAWRVDNDNTDHTLNVPRYTITSKMWEYSRGKAPSPPLFP